MISVDRKDEDAFRKGMGHVPEDTEHIHMNSHICDSAGFRVKEKVEGEVGRDISMNRSLITRRSMGYCVRMS